jgi:hypothetical protein
VRHYPGGLAEWFATESTRDVNSRSAASAAQASSSRVAQAVRTATLSRPRSHVLHALKPANLSTRFIDALSERSVATLFGYWIGMVVVSGVAFWVLALFTGATLMFNGRPIARDVRGLISAVYFSAVTATSVGYGDIVPIGAARLLAIAEAAAGLILFGCVVSKFVSRRQEQLIAEIHHIAFEDRLGRLRSNLHLIRTEVQATARLCEGRDIAPPEAMARVESVAMVFVGELHAVHDLLYRPQQTPDEAVLEAILAGLTSVFREFTDLLECVKALRAADRSNLLRINLDTMSRLAREICGDCVPREFAPSLRTWMDQIQRMAGALAQI